MLTTFKNVKFCTIKTQMIICIAFVIIVQNTPNLAAFQIFNIEFCKVYLDAKLLVFMIF